MGPIKNIYFGKFDRPKGAIGDRRPKGYPAPEFLRSKRMTRNMTEPEKRQRVQFLEGLVPQRNEAQVLLFKLLKLVWARKEALKRQEEQRQKSKINAAFQYTVGATFSLWRAIVLAEKPFEPPSALDDAEELLDRVVRFNTIVFGDEKETKQWMGGFYVTNIQLRLWRLSLFDNMQVRELREYVDRWAAFSKPPSDFELEDRPFDRQTFFEETIKCLKAIVDHLYALTASEPGIGEG